jgi:hypothetical protein
MGKIDRPLSPRKIYENKERYNNGNVISVEYKKIRLNITVIHHLMKLIESRVSSPN